MTVLFFSLLWALVTTMTTRLFINLRSINLDGEDTTWDNLLDDHQANEAKLDPGQTPVL